MGGPYGKSGIYRVEIETPDGQREVRTCGNHAQVIREMEDFPDGSVIHVEVPAMRIAYSFTKRDGYLA